MSLPIKPNKPTTKVGLSFKKSIEFTRIPVVTLVEPPPADGLILAGTNCKIDPERVKFISNRFTAGYADRTGFRDTMEDRITICGNFRNNPDEDYFAIFDGHAGKEASSFCAEYMQKILVERLNEHEKDISNCLIRTFKQTHEQMKTYKTPEGNFVESGTTALVAYFKENELYVANAGDSRAVFSRNKISMTITEDHKPDLEREYKRIYSIPGGYVQKNRVQGKLAVSRAIGDFKYNPYVSEIPDIYGPFNWKDPQYEFLILACDGLWDVLDEQKACDFVRKCKDPREAAIKLRDWAYNERSKDNISVIVIWFPGFIPDYEPPVVQKLKYRNNNAQSNDGKCETSDNSGDSDSESSCDDNSSNYDESDDSESDDTENNNNGTKERQLQEASKKRQQIISRVEKEELSGENGTLTCSIISKPVEKIEEGLSGGNGSLNFSIKSKLKIPSM